MQMKRIKIIIADDHTLMANAWSFLLNQQPSYEVIKCFDNTESLLEELLSLAPDIIIMDVNIMPFNGFETSQKIKQLMPGTSIIGVSMHNEIAFAQRMMESGAAAYVTKSSHQDELFNAIEAVLAGKTYICSELSRQNTVDL
jgi:DNA-binding NarL/FixJ family response regulator